MYTECPTCRTLFRVHASHLAVAGGKVRCGECLTVFDAREFLREDLEEAPRGGPSAGLPETESVDPLFTETPSETAPARARSGLGRDQNKAQSTQSGSTTPHSIAAALDLEFASAPVRTFRGFWIAVSVLLCAGLVIQYAYYDRARLAGIPLLRPALVAMCDVMNCALQAAPHPDSFELTGRSVQSHPSYQGALLIDATFVNRADMALPYPRMEITFTDTEGKPIASRRFLPAEYLGAEPQQALAAGAEAHGVLELVDPGDQAVGYEFRFF